MHKFLHFGINFYTEVTVNFFCIWVDQQQLFMRKICVQNKHKGGNQNKVHEAKTVENIKYEPILST